MTEPTDPTEIAPVFKDPARRVPKSILFKQRALYLYERHRGSYDTDMQFCDAFGLAYGRFRKLKSKSQVFRETLSRFDAERDNRCGPRTLAPARARSRWKHLDLWKGIFLETWREIQERMAAADAVDKTWSEIKRELAADPAFQAGYDEIQEELDIRVEDRFTKSAVAGKGSAPEKYLTARGSELSKSPRPSRKAAVSPEEAQARYATLFGGVLPQETAAEPARDRDAPESEEPSDALAMAGPELAPS